MKYYPATYIHEGRRYICNGDPRPILYTPEKFLELINQSKFKISYREYYGKGGQVKYRVTRFNDKFECTCPSFFFENHCKHIEWAEMEDWND